MGWIGGIPIGRGAEPGEVADLIAYLASDRTAAIHMAPSSSLTAAPSQQSEHMDSSTFDQTGEAWTVSPIKTTLVFLQTVRKLLKAFVHADVIRFAELGSGKCARS
jgi:hypothetical protein|uniref:Putative short-chain dehydrogenase/reductase SDR n=1 Tax=Agrobacterium tumefaciens TaxID=358 RepID=A0A3Q8BM46_AGRTU|nr:putative short-chain dehydrogenase/reductase SDR [Agrobacterium tumefaciens]QEG98057.1 hypothetical protein AgrTiT37_00094 [Agrobacterium tumefaciens]